MKRLAKFILRGGRKAPAVLSSPIRPKVLVFDFDGTLADTLSVGVEIFNLLSTEFGFKPIDPDTLVQIQDMTTRELMRHAKVPATRLPAIARRGVKELHERIHEVKPFPDIPPLVRELRSRGLTLGIITSNSEDNVRAFLERHDLEYFDFVKSSSRLLGKAKVMKQVIKANRFAPEEVLCIGDEARDIEAAQKAGLKIAAVTWGYNSKRLLSSLQPDYLWDRPEEILELFD